jgi:hypothetical protein
MRPSTAAISIVPAALGLMLSARAGACYGSLRAPIRRPTAVCEHGTMTPFVPNAG